MSNPIYGSAYREKKTKERKENAKTQVIREMTGMISTHLPALSEIPVSPENFNQQAKKFHAFLRTQYSDITRLRFAFIELAKHIAKGNDVGWWQLDIPSTITSVPRTTSNRNLRRFKAGTSTGILHQNWLTILANEKHPRDTRTALADVLISSIIYGGLANPRAVTSLANLLLTEPRPLHLISNEPTTHLWIDLVLEGGHDPLNEKIAHDGGTRWQSLHRFYPDNRTLGRILIFKNSGGLESTDISSPLTQADTWKIIEQRITKNHLDHNLSSLNAFCQGAQSVTETLSGVELPQALAECCAGDVGSVSLPSKQLQNWLLRYTENNAPHEFSLKDVLIHLPRSEKMGTRKFFAETMVKHERSTISPDVFIKQINTALKADFSGLKNTPEQAIKRLQEIRLQNIPLNAAILVDWLLDRLSVRKIKVSSALRYFTEIARLWLLYTNEVDVDDMDESELEQIYQEMLSFKPGDNINGHNYLQGRLQDMHEFASQSETYGLPELTSFFESTSHTQKQSQVRAGYISESNYQSMLQSLNKLTDVNPDTREGFAILLILAYRTGMRRGELLKIRLSDIEKSEESWIYVVNNRYGSNKTYSARRRIPLYLLLLPSEMARFRQYFNNRLAQNKHHTSTLLFSEPHAVTVPHSGSQVSSLIKTLLSFQELHELSFHHLRHSSLTNLFIVMEEDAYLISTLTGYSLEQARKIRSDLFSANPMCSRDRYSAVSGTAGHLSPETTFLHYIHEVSLHVWARLKHFDPILDINQLRLLSGLSPQTLHASSKLNDGRAKLSDFRHEILNRLIPMCRSVGMNKTLRSEAEDRQLVYSRQKPTVLDCYSVLRDLEQGDPISTLCVRYSIEKYKIKGWLDAASKIQELKTKSGNRRHFPKAIGPTAIGIHLAPIRPQDRATATEIDGVIGLLQNAFREDSSSINWCIDYWKNNSSQTKPGTRFTRIDDAIKFVESLKNAIPRSRWDLSIMLGPKVSAEELLPWCSLGISYKVHITRQGKSVQGYLRLRHINEQSIIENRNKNIKQYSSQLLSYIFHMLAIMVDGATISKPTNTDHAKQ